MPPVDHLDGPAPVAAPPAPPPTPPRSPGRPPGSGRGPVPLVGGKAKIPTQKELETLLGTANFVVTLSGVEPQLALSSEEIERLAEAVIGLLKEYPAAVKYIAVGPKLSAWADLAIVVYGIAAVRVAYLNQKGAERRAATAAGAAGANGAAPHPGSTRLRDRDDGQREDGPVGGVPVPDAVGGRDRPQARTDLAGVHGNGFLDAHPPVYGPPMPVDLPAEGGG